MPTGDRTCPGRFCYYGFAPGFLRIKNPRKGAALPGISGAGDRDRTGTLFRARDFKSLVSACSTTPARPRVSYHKTRKPSSILRGAAGFFTAVHISCPVSPSPMPSGGRIRRYPAQKKGRPPFTAARHTAGSRQAFSRTDKCAPCEALPIEKRERLRRLRIQTAKKGAADTAPFFRKLSRTDR